MRILFMPPIYLPFMGGLEILTSQIVQELKARGHEVAVLTSMGREDFPEFEVVDGIEVRRLDTHRVLQARDLPGVLRLQRETWEFIREFQPDIIHAHDAPPALWLYARLPVEKLHPPLVLTLHNVMGEQYADQGQSLPGLLTILKAADWITGVSEDVVADALRLDPHVEGRITLIRNGVVAPDLAPTPVADGPARLLAIGRLERQKAFHRAIAAMSTLVPHHPDLQLTIVGVGSLLVPLEAQVARLGLTDHVKFAGHVDHADIPALLSASTALVMPSLYEGLPLVALEAAWMARPVVSTAVSGASLAVTDGETGLLADPEDPTALADALETIISDRDLARRLGASARERAEREWSLSACVDGYEAVYEAVLGEVGSR